MLPGADFAAVAVMLAACEYYVGGALFSLGLNRSLRGSGRDMMENATISMILAASLGIVGAVINASATVIYGGSDLTGPYEAFSGWIAVGTKGAILSEGVIVMMQWSVAMLASTVKGYLPAFLFAGANIGMDPGAAASLTFGSLIGPWVSMLQGGYMVLQCCDVFATILKNSWFVFVAFGSLAYALPKRLGRGIGGTLISGAIVYYVGLPLMPQFVAYFIGPTWDQMALTGQPVFPLNANWFQIWDLAWGLSPGVNFQIWAIFILPTMYLALLLAISGGVAKVIQASQLSLFPGGLM